MPNKKNPNKNRSSRLGAKPAKESSLKFTKFSTPQLAIVALGFALMGGYFIWQVFASGISLSSNPPSPIPYNSSVVSLNGSENIGAHHCADNVGHYWGNWGPGTDGSWGFDTGTAWEEYDWTVICYDSNNQEIGRNSFTVTKQSPPNTAPSAPSLTSASAGTLSVGLAWSTPGSNGGSAITGYRVYRGTSSGGESLLSNLGVVNGYTDTAVSAGIRYYYKISAVNAVGTSAQSNELSAVPTAQSSPPAKPKVSLTANPASISYNGSTSLSWSSSNSSSCSASWTGLHGTSGSQKVGPLTASKSYSISCSGAGGSASASTTVKVAAAPVSSSTCKTNCSPQAVIPPVPTTTGDSVPTEDFTSLPAIIEPEQLQQTQKHRNWVRDLILGGLIGVITGQVKGAK
jgi:hypothetical protein